MELKKGETFASLLNIHRGDIRVVPTHLVLIQNIENFLFKNFAHPCLCWNPYPHEPR